MKKQLCSVLLCGCLVTMNGCTNASAQSLDLMKGIQSSSNIPTTPLEEKQNATILDVSLQLFKQANKTDTNTLVSPLSIILALAICANGANENTLTQFEETLGMPIDELNNYLYSYTSTIPTSKKAKLHIANSIWYKDSSEINKDFLMTNATYYNAGIYNAPFNATTANDINAWVKQHTDGMIEEILNSINPETLMYIINALSFEAEWQTKYTDDEVHKAPFTSIDSIEKEIDMMYSTEHYYLEDASCTGFMKYYADSDYAFVALLPNDTISINDYISSLTISKLQNLLENMTSTTVKASLPKFQSEFTTNLTEVLQAMGIIDAFDSKTADFSTMSTSTDLYISEVLHKTFIRVDQQGTKAGAVTSIAMNMMSLPQIDFKTVNLNRPFVYLIIDTTTNMPLFIGTTLQID